MHSHEFRSDTVGPHLLITGGVHGDEFEPVAAIRRLVELFERRDPQVASLHGRLTLVPIVNESAYLRGARTAEDGLDLARVCPGDPSGSITERTAAELSALIRSADYYVDLHSGGSVSSVHPLAGYTLHPDPGILASQRRMAQAFNLPIVWGTSPGLQGRSLSVARDAGVPAIYCEHHGSGRCDAAGVADYVAGCLNVMAELAMLERPKPENRVRLTVEDPRPDSGHLQICNPAPITGLFEPAVALGDEICAGQPLGDVVNPLTGDRQTVISQQSGPLIVLRTFARVLEGESVGVVLER
jgi:predicted deacylase